MKDKQDYFDLLTDTVEFYSEDVTRRAMSQVPMEDGEPQFCAYRGANETKCAIGRWIPDELYKADFESNGVVSLQDFVEDGFLDNILVEEKKGFDIKFWEKLQDLHDGPERWNDDGLSIHGKDFVNHIKEWIETFFNKHKN